MSLVEAKTFIYTCNGCKVEKIIHSHRDPKLPTSWSTEWIESCQRGCCGDTYHYCPTCTKKRKEEKK